ncbi:MAG: iron-sulfur cluster repair di-iron protein [Bacteroidales bacterium]|jgi:regulator of cell morphogenesis and NO signaling|nr:iron-sulfur cluster repair di-iron protein [Bacteroidales bacterium]MCI2133414.1 iron-sulfur cluster repair di-iron protein [Bacteroidales bacterium]
MSEKITKEMIVGDIVADNFNRAKVFEHLGIDYCCGGKITLEEACRKKNLDPDKVIAHLETPVAEGDAPNFSEWPLDLLVDYVLKKHHRNFHLHHEELLSLVKKVENAHGEHHPELHEVRKAVEESFEELDSHFAKEEQVLFPQLYEIYAAHEEGRQPAPFHCGSIFYPIQQMMLEHDATGETWHHIADITENFTTPTDGCNSYRLMNQQLFQFFNDLTEHVAIENNLIFPGFIKMEQEGA